VTARRPGPAVEIGVDRDDVPVTVLVGVIAPLVESAVAVGVHTFGVVVAVVVRVDVHPLDLPVRVVAS
jgi:hypothetical protein